MGLSQKQNIHLSVLSCSLSFLIVPLLAQLSPVSSFLYSLASLNGFTPLFSSLTLAPRKMLVK
jgi:hypothetical protein